MRTFIFSSVISALSALPVLGEGSKPYTASVFVSGIEEPWGMAFLPDGQLLVSEKPGTLKLISADGKQVKPITGAPDVIYAGQAGLLDIVIDPNFTDNQFVYVSFSQAGENEFAGTAVARGKLEGDALVDVRVIWQQEPKVESPNHWGSRLAFDLDGNLFITVGDRQNFRNEAQNLASTLGKVLRIKPDGTIPDDNPFLTRSNAKPEIWSYGHRNVQSAAIHPVTGELWTGEHGPQGGDELNVTLAGKNYGWPVITFGEEYGGGKIGITRQDGLEQPVHYWVPSIAPGGMTFYTGKYEQWQGKLFVSAMKFKYLNMISLDGTDIVAEYRMLEEFDERVRDVEVGPDGALYVAFDNPEGRIIRVVPK